MKIRINRKNQFVNRIRKVSIYADEKLIGTIGNGESKDFDLGGETESVYAKLDWCKSQKVENLVDGDTFECGSHIKGLKIILTLFLIFYPKAWVYLRRVEI